MDLQKIINTLVFEFQNHPEGVIPTYIPFLKQSNPNHFGITITLADGRSFSSGDSQTKFSIQSISKMFSYALFVNKYGYKKSTDVFEMIASPFPFNSLKLAASGKPFNPMTNAGAFTVWSYLIAKPDSISSIDIIKLIKNISGNSVNFDSSEVKKSLIVGATNKNIIKMLKERNILYPSINVNEIMTAYYEQCFIMMNTEILSTAAINLADTPDYSYLFKILLQDGLYEYSEKWQKDIGFPAKSSISGSIIVLVPGQMGIAVYAPGVDNVGNSVRAIKALKIFFSQLKISEEHNKFPIMSDFVEGKRE